MNSIKYIFALGVMIALLPACRNSSNYSVEIAELDSLKNEMSTVKSSVEDFDLQKLMMIDSTAQAVAAQLNLGIQDTLDRKEWIILGNYTRAISKRLNKFDIKLEKLSREVDISLTQIEDLITDLEHNALEKGKAMKYVMSEKQKAAELSSTAARLKEKATKAMEVYYEGKANVDSLMERISERMQETEAQ